MTWNLEVLDVRYMKKEHEGAQQLLFLAIPVYLLSTGLRYYSVSHKINGIKPHNKMSLETSVPMSHKTGFIFTFQFDNMKISQKNSFTETVNKNDTYSIKLKFAKASISVLVQS